MRIVVAASETGLDAPVSTIFGRAPYYTFVDTETMQAETMENPAVSAGGGAGVQASQFIIAQDVQAALTPNMGPNAFDVFNAANIPVYLVSEGTVRAVVEAYNAGQLQKITGANIKVGRRHR